MAHACAAMTALRTMSSARRAISPRRAIAMEPRSGSSSRRGRRRRRKGDVAEADGGWEHPGGIRHDTTAGAAVRQIRQPARPAGWRATDESPSTSPESAGNAGARRTDRSDHRRYDDRPALQTIVSDARSDTIEVGGRLGDKFHAGDAYKYRRDAADAGPRCSKIQRNDATDRGAF